MKGRWLNLPIIIVVVVFGVMLFWVVSANQHQTATNSFGGESPASSVNPLTVSQDGTQTTTNVSGADLQQASPPSLSASNSEVNPQQSAPNYCAPNEDPADGCVQKAP